LTPDSGPKVETIQTVSGKAQIRDQDKIQLFLSYFGIFALIPLLTVKDSAYVQWHAKQGITVAGVSVGLAVVGGILSFLPVIGYVVPCVVALAQLGVWVLDVIAMIKAFGGERWEIPVIGPLSQKF
jgi:uncharacterized membrane protein